MKPTLLIVDDEKTTREGLRAALEERYDVYIAEDASAAMGLLESENFDVMLTDFRLPNEDGMKLIARAKSLPKPPICILMTAYGSEELAVNAMKHGADDYIAKGRLQIEELEMRIARALDQSTPTEKLLVRMGTAVGKYWICKRTPAHAAEAMECIGGSGVMEDCIMPRLFRESPVNSIWEGSGNVQCLDMLRAMHRNPGSVETYVAEVKAGFGADRRLDQYVAQMERELSDLSDLEYRARGVVEKMALALQGSLLVRHGTPAVADAFCASRLAGVSSGLTFGNLPRGVDCAAIIARATPLVS